MIQHARSPAKINLFLHTNGKRPNGYHELESLVCFTEWGDDLTVESASKNDLELSGDFLDRLPMNHQQNMLFKAMEALRPYAKNPAMLQLTLHKRIPIGGGIGGGSSNAGTLIQMLQEIWDIDISEADLRSVCVSLGADVPVCYAQKPSYFSGIGERLEHLQKALPECYLVLVNPGESVLTKDIFVLRKEYSWTPSLSHFPLVFKDFDTLIAFLHHTSNDLQPIVEARLPVMKAICHALSDQPGCRLARMSGTGGTCFGIFAHRGEAEMAEKQLQKDHPQWWVVSSAIRRI